LATEAWRGAKAGDDQEQAWNYSSHFLADFYGDLHQGTENRPIGKAYGSFFLKKFSGFAPTA